MNKKYMPLNESPKVVPEFSVQLTIRVQEGSNQHDRTVLLDLGTFLEHEATVAEFGVTAGNQLRDALYELGYYPLPKSRR